MLNVPDHGARCNLATREETIVLHVGGIRYNEGLVLTFSELGALSMQTKGRIYSRAINSSGKGQLLKIPVLDRVTFRTHTHTHTYSSYVTAFFHTVPTTFRQVCILGRVQFACLWVVRRMQKNVHYNREREGRIVVNLDNITHKSYCRDGD